MWGTLGREGGSELAKQGKTGPSGRQRFFLIVLVLALASLGLAQLARYTILKTDAEASLALAVVGPMSGADAPIGASLRRGAELYVDMVNQSGGINGRRLALDALDDADDPDTARRQAEALAAGGVVGTVGHWRDAAARAAAEVYAREGLPAILPAPLSERPLPVGADGRAVFSTSFDLEHQARFLANYARNVLGHRLISVIQDEALFSGTLAAPFDATYRRFGTAIRYTWRFDSGSPTLDEDLARIVSELEDRKDAGALFLAVDDRAGARLLRLIRDARLKNVIVAPTTLTTSAFKAALADALPPGADRAGYTDGMLAATPLLFDTANETAQVFGNRYRQRYGEAPDWVAAYAFEAMHLMVSALQRLPEEALDASPADLRTAVRGFLGGLDAPEKALPGIAGPRSFDTEGRAVAPVLIGGYNGIDMVSALTQLQPIRGGGRTNYIEELRKGKVLYVNDRFMYRTNVVYTGLELKDVSELSVDDNSATLNFVIWFRYRGDFEPQDVVFSNAVDDIVLKDPIEVQQIGDMTYRAYRVTGKFLLNFTQTQRFYGSHVLGVSFSHRKLNRNNLLYVVDVLGMNLASGGSVLDQVRDDQALNPNMGWIAERAWVSQDIVRKSTFGDPAYVGYTANSPEFSRIDLGVLVKPGQAQARDFVPDEYFLYVGIFGLLGSLVAVWMDRQGGRRFWGLQSWLLRLVSWPLLLTSAGNMALESSFRNLEGYYIDMIVTVYDILWWIVPARLLGLALERFVWLPLEEHTGRTIPNVVRVFASATVYSLAVFGIVAFVYDQKITSLLATSGLLAMIVGLAIQANISNIFSGIVLNIERPFNVGDWVKIGDLDEGRVEDITWRTCRIKTRNGYVISLPNGQVSESQVHNFNSYKHVRLELAVEVDARYNHETIDEIMTHVAEKLPNVLRDPAPEARFTGMRWSYGGWVATYEVQIWIDDYGLREDIEEATHSTIWDELIDSGIHPSPDTLEGRHSWKVSFRKRTSGGDQSVLGGDGTGNTGFGPGEGNQGFGGRDDDGGGGGGGGDG